MEITQETLQASIASMEQQLAKATAEADMCRGGIVACKQLLQHLAIPDPLPASTPDEEPPTSICAETGVGQTLNNGVSCGEEEQL